MKKYKLKQAIAVTTTNHPTTRIIKAGTIIYEQKHFYATEEKAMWAKTSFDKEDVEGNPDLFELIIEEEKQSTDVPDQV